MLKVFMWAIPLGLRRRLCLARTAYRPSVNLGRLLRGQVVLTKVELVGPEVNLERDKTGRASWGIV